MNKLSRRSLLRRSSGLAGAAAVSLPAPGAGAQEKRPAPDKKLKVVAVGGHSDDPQTCAGGTLALYADQGHEVIALTLTGGPLPGPDANPEERSVKIRLGSQRCADILGVRLDCLDYSGGNMGEFRYGTACEISGQRHNEFNELLLDKYKPDIVFTHWPIDFHMDHRAASLLTYVAWLRSGKKFPLYYMEAELGVQTQNFLPTHFVDISSVEQRTHDAWKALTVWYDSVWPLHDLMRRNRGAERGSKVAEAFNHHPQSPLTPGLP
ncbi:MAG: PIG-L family deacetylase [Bryobacteraceae bacterium]|nr:PIG-L family deacetylase [Bryobacteraceae bacterium]